MRARLLAAAAIIALAIGINAIEAMLEPPSATKTSAALAASDEAIDTDAPWEILGQIQQMNGQFWTVEGFVFRVTSATKAEGDVPSIGTKVRATGIVQPDGTWLATEIRIGSAAMALAASAPQDGQPPSAPPEPSRATALEPTKSATPEPVHPAVPEPVPLVTPQSTDLVTPGRAGTAIPEPTRAVLTKPTYPPIPDQGQREGEDQGRSGEDSTDRGIDRRGSAPKSEAEVALAREEVQRAIEEARERIQQAKAKIQKDTPDTNEVPRVRPKASESDPEGREKKFFPSDERAAARASATALARMAAPPTPTSWRQGQAKDPQNDQRCTDDAIGRIGLLQGACSQQRANDDADFARWRDVGNASKSQGGQDQQVGKRGEDSGDDHGNRAGLHLR